MDAGGARHTRRSRGQSGSAIELRTSQVNEVHVSDDSDVRPEDSASQVGSDKSVASSKSKAAMLSAKAKALKALQAVELQELRCKQERERIELEMQMAEAEVEIQQLDASSVSGKSVSQVADGSVQFVNKAKLNPEVPAWIPTVQAARAAGEPVLVEANANGNSHQQLYEALQIPKVEVMTFDGNPLKYWAFIRNFEGSVEKFCIGDEARLMRLMQYTVGKARQVVQCCCVMEPSEGYKKAKQLLKERFGNDYLITETWVKKIGSFEAIGPRDKGKLQEFADELRVCAETLRAMNKLEEINNQTNMLKIVEKLPSYLQNSWRKEARDARVQKNEIPGILHLTAFIERAAEIANDPVYGMAPYSQNESTRKDDRRQGRKYEDVHIARPVSVMTNVSVRDRVSCPLCSGEHVLFKCEDFKKLSVQERFNFVRTKKLCDNCLRHGHRAVQCLKPTRCTVPGCGGKHTRFLHFPTVQSNRAQVHDNVTQNEVNTSTTEVKCALTGAGKHGRVALPVVPVRVSTKGSNRYIDTCALLDSGSTNSFCSEELSDCLGAQGERETFSLTTLGKAGSTEEGQIVSLEIADINGANVCNLDRVYTRKILPLSMSNVAVSSDVEQWPHLRDLELPDVSDLKIMMLIGQDVPEALMCLELRHGPKGGPYAVRTPFGWTVNGPMKAAFTEENNVTHSYFINMDLNLEEQVEKFWRLESNESIAGDNVGLSVVDQEVLSVWNKTTRFCDGHYETVIPFKQNPPCLPDNREMAEQRLHSLRRRLERDPQLMVKYKAEMEDLLAKGYAEEVSDPQVHQGESTKWYLPHHPVLNPNKPDKVRIVFDCAARYGGISLNDQVHQGPDFTNKLVGVLLRFRQEKVAVMADIESMFHQVRVTPSCRDVLRFLWWSSGDPSLEVKIFRMKAHLFGGVWSPSCCGFVLRKVADDNASDFSQAAVDTVKRNFYVDDCLKSVSNSDQAAELVKELCELLARGGFKLTKWLSNDRAVLKSIPDMEVAAEVQKINMDMEELPTERALGVQWDVESDSFGYRITVRDKPLTRRGILSIVSSVYDPLGFVSPFTLTAKKMIQELCRRSVGWDEDLPEDILTPWISWMHELPKLNQVKLPRCIKPDYFGEVVYSQLHHFCDASRDGYGCVSYLRLVDSQDRIHCSMLMAKSRLAPLKELTIPRLELMAATLAVKMDQAMDMDLKVSQCLFWTDSTAVLKYIRNRNLRFHTFVANRLSVIHAGSSASQWHHISTHLNPADYASRGMCADMLISNSHWFNGPDFLWTKEENWPPELELDQNIADSDVEVRKKVQVFATESEQDGSVESIMFRIVNKRSSWYQLKRDICWILRVKHVWCHSKRNESTPSIKLLEQITVEELKAAETELLKLVQRQRYAEELEAFEKRGSTNRGVKKTSSLYRLEPVVNPFGLLVIGGRLGKSSLSDMAKHPVILPKSHHIVNLIVKHFHEVSGHSGKEHTLSLIRMRYWIVNARSVVRKVINNCVICRRCYAAPLQQKMSDLPKDRVTPGDPPFTYTGVDLFGPFEVKRGRSLLKRYGCIFVCLTIKAVHIEVTSSLETDSFINALLRFISRRGQPIEIRSDNGTNFVGADRELRKSIKEWNQTRIAGFLAQREIKWSFNPPAASHMGGIWERQIRSIRRILATLLKQQHLDDECLSTLMCTVESIINSRPLTTVSDDHRDLEPITPNHLLLLRAGPATPLGIFVSRDVYRRRWRQVQYLADLFWRRWTKEYLPLLQLRQKWTVPVRNVQVGDVVLIVDYSVPRNSWSLARVTETFPGEDGLVRSARVSTSSNSFVRPIHKLCLIESADET